MVMKISLLWPPELVITESMFTHFTGLAEVASYLKNTSEVRKKSGLDVQVVDCAVEIVTALNLANIAYESKIVAVYVNMNNVLEAIKLLHFLKSVNGKICTVVYGEAVSCNPILFSKVEDIDYVIGNGQAEYGLEYVIIRTSKDDLLEYYDAKDCYADDCGKIININKRLPENKWGIPDFDIIPIKRYLELSKGEIHLLVNKGCPFHCEFCNERIVSSNRLYYRDQDQVVDYICADYDGSVNSIYLDASTFTYDKRWILELCKKVQKREKHLNWKTCTRLDCIDEEIIREMAKSGCTRISIGVETFDEVIQKRNRKLVDEEKLVLFSRWCHEVGIQPRALLIIGLDNQSKDDIYYAMQFCQKRNIDARFRVLQDYSALINCNDIASLDVTCLDRWNTWNPFVDMNICELRSIEYPLIKSIGENYV